MVATNVYLIYCIRGKGFYYSLFLVNRRTANAAPEWQARTLHRKQRIDGGLSTLGACYPFLYAVTLLWSAS
jgi:hypothetical protein